MHVSLYWTFAVSVLCENFVNWMNASVSKEWWDWPRPAVRQLRQLAAVFNLSSPVLAEDNVGLPGSLSKALIHSYSQTTQTQHSTLDKLLSFIPKLDIAFPLSLLSCCAAHWWRCQSGLGPANLAGTVLTSSQPATDTALSLSLSLAPLSLWGSLYFRLENF